MQRFTCFSTLSYIPPYPLKFRLIFQSIIKIERSSMNHFLDIAGAFLYVAFRILVLPVLLVLSCMFAAFTLLKFIAALPNKVRRIKVKLTPPLYRVIRFRFSLSK